MLHNKLNVGQVLQVNRRFGKFRSSFLSQTIQKKKKIPKISHDLMGKGFNRLNQSEVEKSDSSIKTI